ncbi:hypothetical protein RM549_18835 [Salegentibacter sp. F188]|uniref:Uncharacterized protein n=1 Tax=Autumnicola patrickiae TaxID=3075591 RepID=A0ABU3E7D6_9FLAO|nr:hypothetical protein [Salegentibacter sp. F188]MDT0691855.1 hypothetical protein [Salegentibacter sp. F188]
MKKFFVLILVTCAMISCDSGDIIVTSFDLEDSQLQLCGRETKVLYATNSEDVYESMSLLLSGSEISSEANRLRTAPGSVELTLNNTNRLVYRIYNGPLSTSSSSPYFCSEIPPSEPRVLEEYKSSSRGTISIRTIFRDETNDADADGDGISNLNEGFDIENGQHLDTDGDGIPDYLDIDDDNDNVPTRLETSASGDPVVTLNERDYRDTDEDGIPNYLDPDDDGDGSPTRNEVNEEFRDAPQLYLNAANIPYYLDRQTAISLENDEYLENVISSRRIRTYIELSEFSLIKQDGSGEEIKFSEYNLGYFDESIEVVYTGEEDSDEDEEENEDDNTGEETEESEEETNDQEEE